MAPYLRAVVAAAVLAAPVWAKAQEAPTPRPAGRVVVLDNERLLEGEVERQGDQLCVRHAQGELVLPAEKVLKVCAGREEAFAYIASRANLRDPDERLRLARWCQINGLYDQAVVQATAAVQMRPGHAESRRVLESVKRSAATQGPGPAAPKPAAAGEAAAPVDVSLESLSAFATKVQPVLMNTCVRCHAGGRGGHFALTRAYDRGPLNHRATQHNLAAVLAQVNLKRPELSPLLIKAVSAHGGNVQAPLRGRDAPPFRLLLAWVETTRTTNPHLWQAAEGQASEAPAHAFGAGAAHTAEAKAPPLTPVAYRPAEAPPVSPVSPPPAAEPGPVVVSAPPAPAATTPTPNPTSVPPPEPAAPAGPADEFDPSLFNQQPPR
jgi:hypothetical protein